MHIASFSLYRKGTKKQPQFSRRYDNHDDTRDDDPHPSSHHHADQVAIQHDTTTFSNFSSQKENDSLKECYSSGGPNPVDTTSNSIHSAEENHKSVKKSILKKFTLDPLKSQLDCSELNHELHESDCKQFDERIEDDIGDHETNGDVGIESSSKLQVAADALHNSRKAPTLPSRTNIMNKLKRKARKHVTFRSISEDTMREQTNGPIMEEDEPLYDDVECGGDDERFSLDLSSGTRRMSSSRSSMTTTATTSSDEANDQNNHHSHTNSPSIGSTSGNTLLSPFTSFLPP